MGLAPNIPLSVNPPAPAQGPLDMAQKGLNVQALINAVQQQKTAQATAQIQQQQQQIELQQAQQQQKDTQIFNKAFQDAGGDWNQTIKNATTGGASGAFVTNAQLNRANQVAKFATADKDMLANEQARSDALAKDAVALKGISDPQERQTTYQKMVNTHLASNSGYKVSDFPPVAPSNDELDATIAHSKAAQDMISEAQKLQASNAALPETKAKAAQAEISTASQWMNGANNPLLWSARRNALANRVSPDVLAQVPEQFSPENAEAVRQMGITPQQASQQPVAKLELADFLKNPPAGYKATPTEFLRYEKSLTPLLAAAIANNTGAGKPAADIAKQFGMTPDAFDQAAEKYYQTGNMPQMGRNAQGMALQRAIMNRTAELHQGASLAEGSAEYKANADSLKKLQGNLDSVSAFENTALKNLQLFRDQAQKVIDTGVPLLNAPLRAAAKMLGSQDQAGFETALQVANNEIAKVTSSPGLSGVLSDSARKEVEAYNPKNATIGQAMHVASILEQDMANRHTSYQQQIQDIQKRMGGQSSGGSNQNTNTNAPKKPADATHVGIGDVDKKKHWLDKNGKDLGVAE